MRTIALLIIAFLLFCIADELTQLRWDYEFVHGMKTCNSAPVCK
jgi:hypothetical protein